MQLSEFQGKLELPVHPQLHSAISSSLLKEIQPDKRYSLPLRCRDIDFSRVGPVIQVLLLVIITFKRSICANLSIPPLIIAASQF